MKLEIQSYKTLDDNKSMELTVYCKPSLFDRLFGDKEGVQRFIGNGKRWYNLDDNWTPCNVGMARTLSHVQSVINYKEIVGK